MPLTTDRVFRTIAGSTILEPMMGVQASVGADSTWRLIWELPTTTLPTGTLKLRTHMRTAGTSGVAKINPKWNVAAAGADVEAITLNAEGTNTVTAAANAWKNIETDITLTASTPLADNLLYMSLVFETSNWTLASISAWAVALVWV